MWHLLYVIHLQSSICQKMSIYAAAKKTCANIAGCRPRALLLTHLHIFMSRVLWGVEPQCITKSDHPCAFHCCVLWTAPFGDFLLVPLILQSGESNFQNIYCATVYWENLPIFLFSWPSTVICVWNEAIKGCRQDCAYRRQTFQGTGT